MNRTIKVYSVHIFTGEGCELESVEPTLDKAEKKALDVMEENDMEDWKRVEHDTQVIYEVYGEPGMIITEHIMEIEV